METTRVSNENRSHDDIKTDDNNRSQPAEEKDQVI